MVSSETQGSACLSWGVSQPGGRCRPDSAHVPLFRARRLCMTCPFTSECLLSLLLGHPPVRVLPGTDPGQRQGWWWCLCMARAACGLGATEFSCLCVSLVRGENWQHIYRPHLQGEAFMLLGLCFELFLLIKKEILVVVIVWVDSFNSLSQKNGQQFSEWGSLNVGTSILGLCFQQLFSTHRTLSGVSSAVVALGIQIKTSWKLLLCLIVQTSEL